MTRMLRRLTIRGAVIGAIAAGAVVAVPQTAIAEAPCQDGTARVFLNNATNLCQSGTATYNARPAISKVCSTSGTKVVVDTTGPRRVNRRHVELEPGGHCARFEIEGQESATVTVSPA
ncbi:hypothetical protein ACFYT3_18015 [Nocardia amikacinitolerans]|uniref:hypothetical protein n=1 Tax=Nocardia amikacinitolerans TaxID=756689 RepID=UPI003675A48E